MSVDVRLYHGDCMEVMRTLEAGSVDAVEQMSEMWYNSVEYKPHKNSRSDVFSILRPDTRKAILMFSDHTTSTKNFSNRVESRPLSDLAAGAAGEHLVCAELLLQGYRAFLADQNCPYDIAVDIDGRLIRIQVKSTRQAKAILQRVGHFPAYMWHVRRAGKGGARVYADGEFDMLALVALDVRRIAYMPPSQLTQTVHIRTHDNPMPPAHGGKSGKTFEQYPFEVALAEVMNG